MPLLGELGEDPLTERFPFPERNDLGGEGLDVLGRDVIARERPRAEDLEILDAVTCDLGIGRRRLWGRSAFADDEFTTPEVESLVGADVVKRVGAHERRRPMTIVFAVELGQE